MNYKNACLKLGTVSNSDIKRKPQPNVNVKERERARFNRSCDRAVNTLYLRWTQYKADYIALHGEDEYERMYLTPNYWVMPEDEDEDDYFETEEEREDAYYSSS